MDIVFIKGLKVETTIGVYDWEKDIKQDLFIDLELSCDTRAAAASDAIADAIDYATLSENIIEFLKENHFQLLETVADKIASLVLAEFDISEIKVIVSKPQAVETATNVGVIIKRSR